MAFDPDGIYYTPLEGMAGPYTPRQMSTAPEKKISIMYKDLDGGDFNHGEISVKVIWVDDVALYLERKPEDDFMVPWEYVMWIEI